MPVIHGNPTLLDSKKAFPPVNPSHQCFPLFLQSKPKPSKPPSISPPPGNNKTSLAAGAPISSPPPQLLRTFLHGSSRPAPNRPKISSTEQQAGRPSDYQFSGRIRKLIYGCFGQTSKSHASTASFTGRQKMRDLFGALEFSYFSSIAMTNAKYLTNYPLIRSAALNRKHLLLSAYSHDSPIKLYTR